MLCLENNNLESLTPGMFSALVSLQIFSLRFNNLRVINQSHLENLKSLKYFDIYGNKLQCSYDIAWFKNWSINTANVHIPYLQSYTCQQPNIKNLFIDFDDSMCTFDLGKFASSAPPVWSSHPRSSLGSLTRWLHLYFMGSTYFEPDTCPSGIGQRWSSSIMPLFLSLPLMSSGYMKSLFQEEGGQPTFKLCLYHQDFELGTDIFENIQNAIDTSRKTLCGE